LARCIGIDWASAEQGSKQTEVVMRAAERFNVAIAFSDGRNDGIQSCKLRAKRPAALILIRVRLGKVFD
jgi:hypothetical protein